MTKLAKAVRKFKKKKNKSVKCYSQKDANRYIKKKKNCMH